MGRAQRNGTAAVAAGTRRSARTKVNAVKNERVTRSSRARLTNGLDDPAQVEKELNEQLKLMSLYAANTTGDGNCLFRALSDQLYGFPTQHARLRQETCDHLAAHADRFAGFVDDQPFDAYVRLMRENGTYGGHLELHAFAQMMQKQIKIVQPGLVYVVSADDDSPEAVRSREDREQERLRMQNSIAPGSEGPPPSSREQRRAKRTESRARKKESAQKLAGQDDTAVSADASESTVEANDVASTSKAGAVEAQPSDALVEAYGPLYIAYHNWEHYSSIRNIDGPHTGLPRIKERSVAAAQDDASSASRASKAGTGTIGEAEEDGDGGEPTSTEKMVLESTRGQYSLAEVRSLLKEHNQDWAQVVEVLVEREIAQDEAAVGSELQALPASVSGQSEAAAGTLAPPTSLPDHMRQWRATSPSSVDTSATHSSGEGDSPSTHATTEEGIDLGPGSPSVSQSSRANTPGADRLSTKRAASADLSAIRNLRGPKRRSQSRSSDESGSVCALSPTVEGPSTPAAEESVEGAAQAEDDDDDDEAEDKAVYEIIKRGRGRPRKDGLPNKSSVVIKRKVPTPREKRDAAVLRKRERQLEKIAKAKEPSPDVTQAKAPAEVRGFRELKI
ncbi:uncharacterized protein PFL1_01602 [Pseudozyma flocculosa PF-1]|uniref:OTU domain-containing protein n=1 Tax=Pseudozyma flocculosa TaxID=84751 RepID=A0A5C3EYV1_9BASI|nr:uncharacterized protein PFL1_01602 [Pseudozyma flocculosa PF-1]EPQ30701.1 hypothetical protein PFL1_01602 [Pseudozyma flocculosa PF-1]SPO36955.1 uncharacterized protein PSFLO_02427 [Pseudozyma flocculosa]